MHSMVFSGSINGIKYRFFFICLILTYLSIAILFISRKWPRIVSIFSFAESLFIMDKIDWIVGTLIRRSFAITGFSSKIRI